VIEKAKEACKNSGNVIVDHFADVGKMVDILKELMNKYELHVYRY